ncbi:sugar ABC transporter substrate-binding protein [Kallotenue papyrolyticum]|uniref:sugar ABC transporter substrate-binding protein n=1 Tax=Kallotenue papyrolyticum TaxID=1325125 RepID=UPI00047859DE|nr:extracellular solute-binding protein [Kallotenue papyrolyticum]
MRRLVPFLNWVLLAILLVACASSQAGRSQAPAPSASPVLKPPLMLTIWHSWSGAKLEALNSIAREYEQAYPEIRIRLVSQPLTDLVGNYSRSVADGAAPQLVILPGRYVAELAARQQLAPLDEPLSTAARETLLPALLDGVRINDRLYALPLTYDGLVLFYDRRHLPEAPATFEQILALRPPAEASAETRTWSLAYYLSLETTLPYLSAMGGALVDGAGRPIFASSGRNATQRWLSWLKQLQSQPQILASTDYSAVDAAVQAGRVWSAIDWGQRQEVYARAWSADVVGIAALPAIAADQPPATLALTEVLAINPVATAEQHAAALAFARTMIASPAQERLSRAGGMPARRGVAVPEERAAVQAALQRVQTLVPATTMPPVWRPLSEVFRSVVANAAPIPEALDAVSAASPPGGP